MAAVMLAGAAAPAVFIAHEIAWETPGAIGNTTDDNAQSRANAHMRLLPDLPWPTVPGHP